MNITHRIKSGIVTKVGTDYANVRFDEKTEGRLYLYDSRFQTPEAFYDFHQTALSEKTPIEFVLKGEKNPDFYYLSDDVKRYRNDWGRFAYEEGAVERFEVERYVDDKALIAHLIIDNEPTVIEAYLHIQEVAPYTEHTIQDYFEIGDRFEAVVERFVPEKMNIELSIVKLRKKQIEAFEAFKTKRRQIRMGEAPKESREIQTRIEIEGEPRVLIIEPDRNYTRSLRKLLEQIGIGHIHEVNNIQTLKNLLNQTPATHALLGYNFGGIGDFRDQAAKLLKSSRLRIALLDAETRKEEVQKFLNTYGFEFLPKPFGVNLLVDFLNNAPLPAYEEHFDKDYLKNFKQWNARNVLQQNIEQKIQEILDDFAPKIQAYDLLLIEEQSPGSYAIIHSTREVKETIRYEKTPIPSVIKYKLSEQRTDDLGDFEKIVPPEVRHLYAYPLRVGNVTRRALVILSRDPIPQDQKARIDDLLGALAEQFIHKQIQAAVEDEMTFADIGRMSAGYMHEIHNEMGILQQNIDALHLFLQHHTQDELPRKEVKNLENEIRRSFHRLKRVNDLFLSTVQRQRPEELNLIETTEKILQVFLAEHMEIAVDFSYERNKEWRLRIPPFPYEQALKNVLLNAAYHLQGAANPRIDFAFAMDARYFYVRIKDYGRGMHRSAMAQLFLPRESKKKGGKGMGLYLSKVMLQSIGGDIDCLESYLYGGTVFEIKLPNITEERIDG